MDRDLLSKVLVREAIVTWVDGPAEQMVSRLIARVCDVVTSKVIPGR